MSESTSSANAAPPADKSDCGGATSPVQTAATSSSASSVSGVPVSKLKAPTNFGGSTGSVSKIGRLCSHAEPKSGPPPRDTTSMSRESDDNLSSINSAFTDLYQETVKRFTRSSLSPEMDRYASSRISTKSTSPSLKSDADRRTSYDLYLEATGRRRSSDHGAVLTVDTEQFIIGQRVWVGGIRSGQIAYIGETHFAPGDWAGVVLDDPNGKNDGCVSGKRYFQCEPKRGIFSRLTRLTLTPLSGAHTPTSPISKYSPERSRTVSPTASIRSSLMRSPGKNGLTVGDRVIVSSGFGSRPGILRYLGETQFASGNWCGIELDEATGKNDGTVDGIRYFDCKPKYGIFVPIAKVSLSPSMLKTRLSRTGSRESLTSVGTMNSIATTNTSRMRSNAQRKASLIRPVSTPKSQYSMQDMLREKQNHIEQLMIERDMDREEAHNQALLFQKNISELKTQITQLERKLDDERKKTDDLQVSIDEATFCGDELNAQTQVYKEKIHDLEGTILKLTSGAPSLQSASAKNDDGPAATTVESEIVQSQIVELTAKLSQQAASYEARIAEIEDESKRMLENVKYLQTENETLQKEMLGKDESLEKLSFFKSGIDNIRHELVLHKLESEKECQQMSADFQQKLEVKNAEVKRLIDELSSVKDTFDTLTSQRTNVEGECETLRSECKNRDEELNCVKDQVAKLRAELNLQKAENTTVEELLKVQQMGSIEGQTALAEKMNEIVNLRQEITELKSDKVKLETNLQSTVAEDLIKLSELSSSYEKHLVATETADKEYLATIQKHENSIRALKEELNKANMENKSSKDMLKPLKEVEKIARSNEKSLQLQLEEKESMVVKIDLELKAAKALVQNFQKQLEQSQQRTEEAHIKRTGEVIKLKTEIEQLHAKTKILEGESSSTVQQMSAKIKDHEVELKKVQDSLKTSNELLQTERQQLTKHETNLAAMQNELKTTATALEDTNKMFEKLKQEYESVLAKNLQQEESIKKGDEECAQQKLALGDLTRKCDATNEKCERLSSQNAALQQDLIAARTSSSEVQTEMRKLNDEIVLQQKAFFDLQTASTDEHNRLQSQISELNQKLANAGKDSDLLKELLQKTKDELIKKNDNLTVMEEKTIKQDLTLSDTQRQLENLQTKYDALATQNNSLQGDLTNLRTTSMDSNAELVKLSQDVAAKQRQYEELLDKSSTERSAVEGQLQASQQRVDALCNQVETLTEELKTASEATFKRFEEFKEATEKSGKLELELGDLTRKLETTSAKCGTLEAQNEALQQELTVLRTVSSDSNNELVKLTDAISSKQQALQELTDRSSTERLQLESQLQELTQRLQGSQADAVSLRNDLKSMEEKKTEQAAEFETLKAKMQANSSSEIATLEAKHASEQQKLLETFEGQLKSAEQTKITLNDAISSLQQQIQLLQDELLKSQLDFKTKEEELNAHLKTLSVEKETVVVKLQQVQNEGSSTQSSLQAENLLHLETIEQQKRQAADQQRKIDELKEMLEKMQESFLSMSATNAGLSEALHQLEAEKTEISQILEIFEIDTDHTANQLSETLNGFKQQLEDTRRNLMSKEVALAEAQASLAKASTELQISQSNLDEVQARELESSTKLNELSKANEELRALIGEKESKLKQHHVLEMQMAEHKAVIGEMYESSAEKTVKVQQLHDRVQQLEKERAETMEAQQAISMENARWKAKSEVIEAEKVREIAELQARINDLQSISKLKLNGSGDVERIGGSDDGSESTAQINFLNSIIADMQKKNDTLKAKIEALEALPTDFSQPNAFEMIAKRKPAPRPFCDICDEFDKHETEDCPLQASDDRENSPTPGSVATNNNNNDPAKKERILPNPRKYCVSCEVFGHEAGECDEECF